MQTRARGPMKLITRLISRGHVHDNGKEHL